MIMLNFAKVAASSDGAKIRAYLTQDAPEPQHASLTVAGVDPAGRNLDSGETLTNYYTGRGEAAAWRKDMPASVAAALGIDSPKGRPRYAELDPLFEARRADTGAPWSSRPRANSGFDFVFAPHKSVSLAAEFASSEAERQLIREAIHRANDAALAYAAQDLGQARKGAGGAKGVEAGDIGWVTFAHDAARPTLAVQDGAGGGTYLVDAPIAGDPHFHLHNFIPNLVVTEDGRIGSIDARVITANKVHELGAIFQAYLAQNLRDLGVRVGYDQKEEAIVALDVPEAAVAKFSKRDRQVIGDAKRYAAESALEWDELSLDKKKQLLHEASAAGRLGKTKEEAREVWRAQAAEIGWDHETVLVSAPQPTWTDDERHEAAYKVATEGLSQEFVTAAVLDHERMRVHAARGLISVGAPNARKDVDAVVELIEQRGFYHQGVQVALISGTHENGVKISHTVQVRIEQDVAEKARAAALDTSRDLTDAAVRAALAASESEQGIKYTREQSAAIYTLGRGGKLSLLTGAAGVGKTTLMTPLVNAWHADGRHVIGVATAWKQADALQDAGVDKTIALQPLLNAIRNDEFHPDANTVLIIDEVSQIGPRPMLKLLELQAATGMTIKMLGDREQVQSIEAGDTIELLRRVLPKTSMPEVLTAVRQRADRDREIATLFRKGGAETALEMKREDGTATLIDGDYDQVVKKIADLYIARSDALAEQDPSMSVTITTLTNAEAADISLAIRERLKARGEIGSDDATYKAVVYRGDKPELYDLPIATGDRLRLYRKTRVRSGHGHIDIGNNGDIVEVMGKTAEGLVLKNARGVIANADWKCLSDKTTGRLLLGPGRAFTIDAAQGMSTKGEHINALPRGTAGTTAFKMYTAESRATGRTHTVISKGAILAAVQRSRALGDRTPIEEDDLWRRVEKDASEKPYKALAIDLLEKGRKQRDNAIVDGLKQHKVLDDAERAEAERANPMLGARARKAFEEGLAREAISDQRGALKVLVDEAMERLREAGEILAEHLRALRDAVRPKDPAPSHQPQSPAQDDEPVARPPSPSMR
ncbi:post-segregation antitoxin (ccd killing protein) [Rhodoblastus acidophilus]|uniref:MobF family relaxase n=1 Tax=Rhodoblastus acidophilus TaxID=1074 RepID=UPI0022252EA4|nr:MobF family relaxase [Rhodoblastus acidophilus]MCW2318585.1 post-segregation antitoxin (ccd killing protein) [Rhodoblastus acidophilus]